MTFFTTGGKYKKIRHALHWAARNGRIAVADWLIHEKHIDVNIEADDGTVPMHFAVWTNNIPMLQWLIEVAHCDLHKLNSYGCNASQWGALNGDVTMLRLLQSYGLDLKLLNLNGHSAVHKAAVNGRLEACQWLLRSEKADTEKELVSRVCSSDSVERADNGTCHLDVDEMQSLHIESQSAFEKESCKKSQACSSDPENSGSRSGLGGGGGLCCAMHMRADKSGNTPAMIARNNGHMETAEWLESFSRQQANTVGITPTASGLDCV